MLRDMHVITHTCFILSYVLVMKILNIQILKAYILYYAVLLSVKVEFSSQLLVEVVQWLICMINNIFV